MVLASALSGSVRAAAGAIFLGWASLACAQAPTVTADPPMETRETRVWLSRVQEAARKQNFAGTFVFSAGGAMSSTRILHYCEGNNQFERIDSLDGPPRQMLRHNDQVHNVWPQNRVVVLEQRDNRAAFPALLLSADDQFFLNYEVRAKGFERIAGHEAQLVQLKPRDSHRFGYRLWSDKVSGLLLRADVIGERNEVLESSAFSDVAIGVKPQPEAVLDAIKKLDRYRTVKSQVIPTKLDAQGWVMRASLPGFREINCFKRPLDGVGAEQPKGQPESDGGQAVQVIYSDGLTHVSLFIEPFNAEQHTRPVLRTMGATRVLSKRQANWWITAVGDVPLNTLKAFADGLERKGER